MSWEPVTPDRLADRLAGWLATAPGTLRVAVDGAPAASPAVLAESLVQPLRLLGRPAVVVRAEAFWRDASLRFEHGRQDLESYSSWLDTDALRREVLDAAVAARRYLPSLRDPATNRSTRVPPEPLAPGSVLVVAGPLLLGRGLPFDRTVHLALSPAALRRRTPPGEAWTLPAFDAYGPTGQAADVVVKLDDPRHPAARGLPANR